MNNDRVHKLAEGYWSATLTPSEEQELRALLKSMSKLDGELATLQIMLGGFDAIASEEVAQHKLKRSAWRGVIRLTSMVSAAAAMVALVVVVLLKSTPTPEAEVYCYINGEPITDIEVALEQTKYLEDIDLLAQTINTLESIMQ